MIANTPTAANGTQPISLDELDQLSHVDEPTPPASPAIKRLLHADELDALPPVTYLDDEGEHPSNSLVVYYGLSGGGKSFRVLGKAFNHAQTRDVVYVAAEGAHGYAARKNALCLHHKQGSGRLFFWPYAVNLLNAVEVQEFIAALAPLDCPIVIFDTLARCMVGGDENSAKDMGIAIAACDTVRHATGETVIIVHHTGKNGSSERGSSALRGAADAMIEITNDDGLITISCSKMKDGSPFEPRHLRLVEVGESCVLVPAEQVITTKHAPLAPHEHQALTVLNYAIFEDTGAKSKDLESAVNMPRPSLFRTLSRLKQRGYISQGAKGDPYYITETGRAKLQDEQQQAAQRSINKKAHSNAQVSLVSSQSQVVSDTVSIKYHPVSHSFRSDTGDTTETTQTHETSTVNGNTPPAEQPALKVIAHGRRRNGGAA
jgi:DNA-binding MarR family transcriptional regulator